MHNWTESDFYHANLSAPRRDVMRFSLVYHGQLSASASKPKTKEAASIRDHFSKQLKFLWENNRQLKTLEEEAWIDPQNPNLAFSQTPNGQISIDGKSVTSRERAKIRGGMVSLCAPLKVTDKFFKPLVRQSIHANCDISVLFMRQEDPGASISQGGDIDNRIKTLLDALRVPSDQEMKIAPPKNNVTHCLMESDTLVSSLEVNTERLLFPETEYPNEVHLVIEVSLRLLEINKANVYLL